MSFLDKIEIAFRAIQYHLILLDIQEYTRIITVNLNAPRKRQNLLHYLDKPLTEIYAGRGRCALYTWSVFCRSDRAARGSSTESRSGRHTLRPHSPPSVGSVKTINI